MTIKEGNHTITFKLLFVLFIQILLFVSCADGNSKKEEDRVQKYDGVTIDVDISNKNSLAILLAKDGTINRKGSGMPDSLDKDFFIGITNDNLFDSLMNGISDELLAYCNTSPINCDTTKQTYKVK